MRRSPQWTSAVVTGAVHMAGLALGVSVWAVTREYAPAVGAFVGVGVLGAMFLLANTVVKDVNEFFSAQLGRLQQLDDFRRRESLASYISERRAELNLGWVAANLAGAVCAAVAGLYWNRDVRAMLSAERWWLILLGALAAAGLALPTFVRVFRFQLQRDRFQLEVTDLLDQQQRRNDLLMQLSPPERASCKCGVDLLAAEVSESANAPAVTAGAFAHRR